MDIGEDLKNNPWAQFIGTNLENLDGLEEIPDYEDPKDQTNTKLLPDDMNVYGSCPVWEEFSLITCKECNCMIIPAAISTHMVQRHSNKKVGTPAASTSTSTTNTNVSASATGSCSNTASSWKGSEWTANNNASHGLQSSVNTSANIVRVKLEKSDPDNKSTSNRKPSKSSYVMSKKNSQSKKELLQPHSSESLPELSSNIPSTSSQMMPLTSSGFRSSEIFPSTDRFDTNPMYTSVLPPQSAPSSLGQPMDVSDSSSSEKKTPTLEKLVLRRVLQTNESTSADGRQAEGIKGVKKDSTAETYFMVVKKDCEQNLLATRKRIRKTSNEDDPEKDVVQKKLKTLESFRDNLISQLFHELESVKEKLHQCTLSKTELQSELRAVREQVQESRRIAEQCRMLSEQNSEYQKEIKELQEKLDLINATTGNLIEQSPMYGNFQAYNYAMEQMAKQLEESEDQKLQFQKRLEDLEAELSELKNSSKLENRNLELKLKHYCRIIGELKNRLDRQVSENEELRSQKEFLEKHLPQEVMYRVKGQLIGITRRAELFEIYPGLIPGQPIPALAEKLLADIQNIDYRSFQQQVANDVNEMFQQTKKDVL
ncbi:uncharacterized protein NPIL_426091 [Nephila pilipes]|uniref:Uncharacterized protein n=1 Tax=Nephila pilipes TaxID=299642 RepID=A0A8X6IL00_NEPPI|nr:uncharacterized protein NPIL_426091 [Nephila pilipes]